MCETTLTKKVETVLVSQYMQAHKEGNPSKAAVVLLELLLGQTTVELSSGWRLSKEFKLAKFVLQELQRRIKHQRFVNTDTSPEIS